MQKWRLFAEPSGYYCVCTCMHAVVCTVEPLNNGHFGISFFGCYIEVAPSLRGKIVLPWSCRDYIAIEYVLYREVNCVLYLECPSFKSGSTVVNLYQLRVHIQYLNGIGRMAVHKRRS